MDRERDRSERGKGKDPERFFPIEPPFQERADEEQGRDHGRRGLREEREREQPERARDRRARGRRLLHVDREREENQGSREDVLPRRDPGHVLDVRRVGEEDEPRGAGRDLPPTESPRQHDDRGREDPVEEDVPGVEREGTVPEERRVERVADLVERVVRPEDGVEQDLLQVLERALVNEGYVREEDRVVVGREERVSERRGVERGSEGSHDEKRGDRLPRGHERAILRSSSRQVHGLVGLLERHGVQTTRRRQSPAPRKNNEVKSEGVRYLSRRPWSRRPSCPRGPRRRA